eukprot:COSAG01_NODE_73941_length_232_cov_28.751880_1_plen_22_part_01
MSLDWEPGGGGGRRDGQTSGAC